MSVLKKVYLNFIKSVKWIDFAYLHNVRIFPGTELEVFAIEAGIPREMIKASQDMSYHESSPTLPFSKEFSRSIRTSFLYDYVFKKERLLARLPYQMQQFTEDELNQKYNSFFPSQRITSFNDVVKFAKISELELEGYDFLPESADKLDDFHEKSLEFFPQKIDYSNGNPLKLFLVDLSTYFSEEQDKREYNVLEPPLGLMALTTYINEKFGNLVQCEIKKSLIDFDSFEELHKKVDQFDPNMIGCRTMTFYSSFFHNCVLYLRNNGINVPIITGGPYATASYSDILTDKNIDLCIISEGEHTINEIISLMLNNGNKLPAKSILQSVQGIAFLDDTKNRNTKNNANITKAAIPVTNALDEIMSISKK